MLGRCNQGNQYPIRQGNQFPRISSKFFDDVPFTRLQDYFYSSPTYYWPQDGRTVIFQGYAPSAEEKEFVLITNNMNLDAKDKATLYKNRLHVEHFLKWIKQHLRVKSFWGTSMNVVKIQVYCAIITYCLVVLVGNTLKVDRSIYGILQTLNFSIPSKTSVNKTLTNTDYNIDNKLSYKQLIFNWE